MNNNYFELSSNDQSVVLYNIIQKNDIEELKAILNIAKANTNYLDNIVYKISFIKDMLPQDHTEIDDCVKSYLPVSKDSMNNYIFKTLKNALDNNDLDSTKKLLEDPKNLRLDISINKYHDIVGSLLENGKIDLIRYFLLELPQFENSNLFLDGSNTSLKEANSYLFALTTKWAHHLNTVRCLFEDPDFTYYKNIIINDQRMTQLRIPATLTRYVLQDEIELMDYVLHIPEFKGHIDINFNRNAVFHKALIASSTRALSYLIADDSFNNNSFIQEHLQKDTPNKDVAIGLIAKKRLKLNLEDRLDKEEHLGFKRNKL